ncbi:unnamed protein product [Ceutorhynchus assimilis]|uniref:Serine aminopeptidase S33 domain-containing protein n=1 Tax=Ceutorhynchus assimilis TaxID=467358 RepID=A0A9N9MCV9_9CUCU|nr:unnamed protein product [Ceutorhynchus assimilis]
MCSDKCCVVGTVITAVLVFLVGLSVFIIAPIIFMSSVGIQKSLVFPANKIGPINHLITDDYRITGVRNMYIDVPNDGNTENVTLGLWQILPQEIVSDKMKDDEYNFDGVLSNEKHKILLYLHDNRSDRTKFIKLYKILREFFHIFAIDYRGYGDSTGSNLTETNMVNDMKCIFKWIQERSKSKIFVWGHSLGAGIATHLIAELKKEHINAIGLVLEAPFTSVIDVMKTHPVVKFYSIIPWRQATILNPIKNNDMNFDSKSYIKDVDCPIMILHAEDDEIIPFKMATELYDTAINKRNSTYQGNVTFHLYPPEGKGHMLLYSEPDLSEQVRLFIKQCLEFSNKNQ